jgi:hypothetical protein
MRIIKDETDANFIPFIRANSASLKYILVFVLILKFPERFRKLFKQSNI